MGRRIYLDNLPLEDALDKFFIKLREKGLMEGKKEMVLTCEALGRITAAGAFAEISSPHYHASAMDGYAVKAEDTFGASDTRSRYLKTGDQAQYVDTGDPLPSKFNAVVMIEKVHEVDNETIEINSSVVPWEHVRIIGENVVKTELILSENVRIGPAEIGALLSGGVNEVAVWKKPSVAVIPTGTELVPVGAALKEGDIIDFNSHMLAGYVKEWGGESLRYDIVVDHYPSIKEAIIKATKEADIVVTNAGSSAGSEDFTSKAVDELGDLLVHGVGIKPGKPVILGVVNDKPFIGLPGYPVSATLTAELFLKSLMSERLGRQVKPRRKVKAILSRRVVSTLGSKEFVRVKLGKVGDKLIATPMGRGASVIMSLVQAEGQVSIGQASEGLEAREEVEVELFGNEEAIDNTLVAIGSHDMTMDILASELRKSFPEMALSSAHVGSMGGLMALRKGEAHLAGIHLLDEEIGEYNHSYVNRLLPNQSMVLVNMVYRMQGLMVLPGNPKDIRGIEDLIREDVMFVNRQRGAGTRILLDYMLKEQGIEPEQIAGYQREDFTHMAVAAAVVGNVADVGMGILGAAEALGLDFIPLKEERYDLAVSETTFKSEHFQKLLQVINSNTFKTRVESLGGYSTRHTGLIMGGEIDGEKS